jgi:hypothetical protein
MAEYCQNPECCYKKTTSQIRGNKGNKYYQSNKAHQYYYDMFCSQGCFHKYFDIHKQAIQNAIPEIGKQTVEVENAWSFRHEWTYNSGSDRDNYFLVNKLMGIRHTITREQAQTQEQIDDGHGWRTKPDSLARPLAEELGLSKA